MHLNQIILFGDAAPAAAPAVPTTSTAVPAGTPPQQQPGSPLSMILPMGLIFVAMYFLMIRPQNQQRKKQAALLATLKAGDKVVTSSGIIGVVITVKDNSVSLRSADAKMEMAKSSVVQIVESGTTSAS